MVSWTADGLIAGYDAVTKRLKADLYHLASAGSVDLQGITRLQNKTAAGLSTATYPNTLQAKAPMSFVAADFTANPGRKLAPVMIFAPAGYFPDGYVPKPSEIYNLALTGGPSRAVARLPDLIYDGPISRTFTFTETNDDWPPNLKYWVLIYPASFPTSGVVSTFADIPPMNGASIDTVGRAVSIWSNRGPTKPTITSPAPGAVVSPGNTFTLAFTPNDSDKATPEDPQKYNDDIVGLQIQYAPAPTAANPNPTWSDLQVAISGDGSYVFLDDCWIIKGANGSGTARLRTLANVVNNLSLPILAGAGTTTHVEGRGEIPTGDWMLRVRTFDFGHPYPNEGTDYTMPGPSGVNQATTMIAYPAKDNYASTNTSPWSDPVKVSIPAQVQPPIPLSPINHEAVSENTTVRLKWQYRNSHIPAYNQYFRTVQIRKVGDPNWATVANGVSGNPYIDLPPALTQAPLPASSLLADPTFEGGTVDGWFHATGTGFGGQAVNNVLDATKAHSGSRCLIATNNGTDTDKTCSIIHQSNLADLPASDYITLRLGGWVYIPDPTLHPILIMQVVWLDGDHVTGNNILDSPTGSLFDSPFMLYFLSDEITTAGWHKISDLPITGGDPRYGDLTCIRPPAGKSLQALLQVAGNTGSLIPEVRFDDLTLAFDPVQRDSFSMSATEEYEWQVQTMDTEAAQSLYSQPAPFWVVPNPDSGSARPISTAEIEGATLGCGTHRVQVFRRGGKTFVGEIKNISHLDYSRVRDDISTANIVVSGWDVDCGNLLAKLQTWAYELVIWRDNGYSVDRVWEGPITLLTYEVGKVTIDAKDVMAYPYRRIIKQQMSDSGTGNGTTVVDRARRVLQNVMAPDDPNVLAYMQVLSSSDDAMQHRSTPAYSRTAFEEIDDMASNAGLDYTVVGRSIMLWGTKHRIGTLPEFTDEDLGNSPIVSEYGMSFANRYAVSDGNGVWGEATRLDVSGNDETYGLVEMLSSTWASDSPSDTGTYTQAGLASIIDSFEHFAERAISDRNPPPVVVRIPDNTSLNPGAVISIQHLVPGVVIPLRSTKTLRTVVASQKLDSIKVVEEKGKETVSITVSPFNSDSTTTTEGT